jgi:hypothetical protein
MKETIFEKHFNFFSQNFKIGWINWTIGKNWNWKRRNKTKIVNKIRWKIFVFDLACFFGIERGFVDFWYIAKKHKKEELNWKVEIDKKQNEIGMN